MFLENRRGRKDLFCYDNGSEVDLCDAGGTLFVNTCWNLADADTFQREKAAMAFGADRWPEAEGTLLYHEYGPGREREVPGAQAAWRYLLRPREARDGEHFQLRSPSPAPKEVSPLAIDLRLQ